MLRPGGLPDHERGDEVSVGAGPGACPGCDARGEVGSACANRACSRRGWHFVPDSHWRSLTAAASSDGRLGTRLGDYLLVGTLGVGGFGRVYLGLQLPILMRAAVKVLDREGDDPATAASVLRKFEQEAQALAALSHPGIVRMLQYGVDGSTRYLAMEVVEGGRTLKAELGAHPGGLAWEAAWRVLVQLCNALAAAHASGIVHRDIKPENVMLQQVSGEPWLVRVLDFGLAKFLDEGSETSVAMGTPAYLAPEQLLRRHIGPWTDVYATAIVACELLTGGRPFCGVTTDEVLAEKLFSEGDCTERLRELGLPDPVVGVLAAALRPDPMQRTADIQALRDQLEAAWPSLAASPQPAPAHAVEPQRAPDRPSPSETVAVAAQADPAAPTLRHGDPHAPTQIQRPAHTRRLAAALVGVAGGLALGAWLVVRWSEAAPDALPPAGIERAPAVQAARAGETAVAVLAALPVPAALVEPATQVQAAGDAARATVPPLDLPVPASASVAGARAEPATVTPPQKKDKRPRAPAAAARKRTARCACASTPQCLNQSRFFKAAGLPADQAACLQAALDLSPAGDPAAADIRAALRGAREALRSAP